MRVWIVALLLLAGCADAPAEPATDAATAEPSAAPDPPPAVAHVDNLTIFADGRSNGAQTWSWDEPGYHQFFLSTPDPVRVVGNVRMVVTTPSGAEIVLLDGVHAQDETDENQDIGGCGVCDFRFDYETGVWRLEYQVEGRLSMRVVIEAL